MANQVVSGKPAANVSHNRNFKSKRRSTRLIWTPEMGNEAHVSSSFLKSSHPPNFDYGNGLAKIPRGRRIFSIHRATSI
jgi:hypothetical protein